MKTFRQLLLILFCMAIFSFYLFSQVLPLQSYTTKDGLISNWITAVLQDSRGYLWVGTSDGISVYDGASFTNYTTEDGLSNSFITALLESRHHPGTIWIGTIQRGLTKYSNGRFTSVPVGSTLNSNTITSIAEDTTGTIWCATSGGVFCVQADTAQEFIAGNRLQRITTLVHTHQGLIWAGGGRMVRLFTANGQQTDSIVVPIGTEEHIESLSIDREGDIWVGGSVGSVLVYRNTRLVWRRKFSGNVYDALLDQQGFVWLTTLKGIQKVKKADFADGAIVTCDASKGFPATDMFAALEDREGNIWFGTYHKGVIKLAERGLETMPIQAYTNKAALDSAGHLWLPTRDGIREVWIQDEGQWGTVLHRVAGVGKSNPETPLVFDHQGRLWVVSDTGLRCFAVTRKPRQQSIVRLAHSITPPRGFPIKFPLRAHIDRGSRLWYSMDSVVVVVELTSPPNFEGVLVFPRDIPVGSVRAIFEDRRGDIWLGDFSKGLVRVQGGLLAREGQGWNATAITHFTMAGGLPDDGIRSFYEDKEGRLWIGTRYGGVALYEGQGFKTISMRDGLISNCIWWMARDSAGGMWLATALGLMAVHEEGTHELMNETAGRAIDFCAAAPTGLIWFGSGLESIGAYYLTKRRANLVPPPVYISQFAVNDTTVPIDGDLEFSSTQNNCSIQYIGISLRDEQSVRYRFRLNNAEWSRPVRQRNVSFAALSPGAYTFEVRAMNADGIMSEQPAQVSFTILPPFWRRWWFVVLAACVVGLLIYLAYLYRVRQLLHVERLRTRIATDLHDDIGASLTRIALFSDIAKDEARQSAPKLTDVAERIGNDARELLEAVSTLVWSIDPRHDSFDDVLTYMKEFAQEMFDMKGIAYRFSADIDPASVELPVQTRRNLLLLYKEAVNNVVRHSGCTEAHVDVAVRNGGLILSVADNGIGFPESDPGGGHGISNMRARAAAVNARFSITSDGGKGTRVDVQIPVG